jgi:hypothetical protein
VLLVPTSDFILQWLLQARIGLCFSEAMAVLCIAGNHLHTVLLRSDGQALASGYNKDNAKFHHWMLDSSTPKFLRATTIQLFFEVMVLRWLVDTICTSSATFRLWNTA